jgi:DNA polymerase III alpha subunit
VVDYVLDKHIEVTKGMCESDIIDRDSRLISELMMYKEADKLDVLRTIIYMVEMLEQHNVVYGVGRGSSVSSYVLYVIGIHDIDSFAYDLDINDFFHD